MTEENKNLSQVADTAIDKALLDIQVAFATMDWQYTYDMLRKAVYVTADQKIIDECESFMREVARNKAIANAPTGYGALDKQLMAIKQLQDLKETDFDFLKKLMFLLKPYLRYAFGPKTHETGIAKLEKALGERFNE